MKKEIIICTVVIIMLVLANLMLEKYTDNAMENIVLALEDTKKELTNKDENKMKEKIEKSINIWQDEKHFFSFYIEHDELEKVEMYLLEVKSNIETKEYNIAIQALDTSKFVIEHIKEKYDFTLKNIF